MKNKILILCALAPFFAAGQIYDCYNAGYCKVTAKSGLNIRTKPSAEGPKLGTIPTGEEVLVCYNCDNCPYDTIEGIGAPWQRVFYKDISGYAFSGFLEIAPPKERPGFTLLHDWHSDWDEAKYFEKGKTYYGLYVNKSDPSKHYYRKIDTKDTLLTGSQYPNGSKAFQKMIGKDAPFAMFYGLDLKSSNNIKGKKIGKYLLPGDKIRYKIGTIEYIISASGVYSKDKQQIHNHRLKVSQNVSGTISTMEYLNLNLFQWSEDAYEGGIKIEWIGDLDQDGKLDVMLSYSQTYKGEDVILLLSSKAEKGHFFKEVCRYSHSCC